MNANVGAPAGQEKQTWPTTRVQWIKNWAQEFPDRPVPCSAKAVYRLADSEYPIDWSGSFC
jgi:hypothetical protein